MRIKTADLKPGPIRHQQLPPELMTRIESLHSTFQDMYPMSMTEWADGFQRDAHPEQEVMWWERLAWCYTEYCSPRNVDAEERNAAFNVIFKIALGAPAADVAGDLDRLPTGALNEILAIMRSKSGAIQ
jgi:hypothetical protein